MTVHLRGRRCPGARVLPWLLLSAVLLSCSEFGDSVVARSGSDRLTVRDLRLAYANTQPLSRPPLNTRRDRLAFLNQVLDHRLLLDHGRALVAANDLVPDAAYERGRMECLVQRLLTLEGEGWQPNESDVEEYGLYSPDNLASDTAGNLYIVEDNSPADIWVAGKDLDGDGAADDVSLFATLTTPGAEGTGIYFARTMPGAMFVNVQHAADGNDMTVLLVKEEKGKGKVK